MNYEELHPISREQAELELQSGDWAKISETLFRLALFDEDGVWVEALLLRYLRDQHDWVRGSAATCLSHIARIHRSLDVARVVPALQELLHDASTQVRGRAEDALDDIEHYLGSG